MRIQFKRWDGKSMRDPNSGTPMEVSSPSINELLRGKVVQAVGGVTPNTENVQIQFMDRTQVWFVTAAGQARIIVKLASDYP